MAQISVIIPVHNVEKYVGQCVRSVQAQTLADMEIICVDNSCTDNSMETVRRLAQADARIKIFNSVNQGPGSGRNKGLDEATGKYVLFVDADDFIEPQMCQVLWDAAEKDNLDMAACDYCLYHDDTGTVSPRERAFELACRHDLDVARGDTPDDFAKFCFAFSGPCYKLIRRELLERVHLRFPLGAVEDAPFVVSAGVLCKRLKMADGAYLGYYRVGRAGNISGNGEKMLLDGIKNFAWLENNLRAFGVFEQVKETFWFNKMVLLIGDERLFAGRLGNVPPEVVKRAYDLIRADLAQLDLNLFARRNALFRWKVRALKKAVAQNDLGFPRRLRKVRNIAMIFLDPWYKLKSKISK